MRSWLLCSLLLIAACGSEQPIRSLIDPDLEAAEPVAPDETVFIDVYRKFENDRSIHDQAILEPDNKLTIQRVRNEGGPFGGVLHQETVWSKTSQLPPADADKAKRQIAQFRPEGLEIDNYLRPSTCKKWVSHVDGAVTILYFTEDGSNSGRFEVPKY